MKPLLNLTILLFLVGCNSSVTPLTSLLRDEAASKLLKKDLTEAALDQYIKVLETSPNEPSVHSNIGVLLNKIQKSDDALKSLQLALKLAEDKKDLAQQFAIRYNLGSYYGALKKIPEALDNYQAALDIVPTSKETRTNIELLIQSQQQDQKQQNKDGESKEGQDQNDQKKEDGKDQENKDNKKDGEQKPDDKDKDGKDKKDPKENKDYKGNSKYQPRPFKGDQLSEGDVKKILGELRNQEQKIRANFDKKERKESKNEKDW